MGWADEQIRAMEDEDLLTQYADATNMQWIAKAHAELLSRLARPTEAQVLAAVNGLIVRVDQERGEEVVDLVDVFLMVDTLFAQEIGEVVNVD